MPTPTAAPSCTAVVEALHGLLRIAGAPARAWPQAAQELSVTEFPADFGALSAAPHASAPPVRGSLDAIAQAAWHVGECYQRVLAENQSAPSDATAAGPPVAPRSSRRKVQGAYYTPRGICRQMIDDALVTCSDDHPARQLNSLTVMDPACGTGNFLLEFAAMVLAAASDSPDKVTAALSRSIHGCDIDPLAIALARINLWTLAGDWSRSPSQSFPGLVCGDSLAPDARAPWGNALTGTLDLVIGNPPYLNQLRSATARPKHEQQAIAKRFNNRIRGYADQSLAFVLLAAELARPGGVINLLLPQSICGAAAGATARAWLESHAPARRVWTIDESVFDAGVHVCAITLQAAHPNASHSPSIAPPVQRTVGLPPQARPAADPADLIDHNWAPLLCLREEPVSARTPAATHGPPNIQINSLPTLGDYCTATADFRDQFYGLIGAVIDAPPGTSAANPPPGTAALITSGLIHKGHHTWGRQPVKLHGQRYNAPLVVLERLSPAMQIWAAQRLVPKLLLATQTREIETMLDETGTLLPSVPVVTITLKGTEFTGAANQSLATIQASLHHPLITQIARTRTAGLGMSPGAIKLSAKSALRLPILPPAATP